jgi:hypothetical protein
MKLWAVVYDEHYLKYCILNHVEESQEIFQQFLKEIGTPMICFDVPTVPFESNYIFYKEVPSGSCVTLHTPKAYAAVIRRKLYKDSDEKPDKSRRSSSCSII